MSSHKYGLATDWIVGMTVVLANGNITRCSATENPSLFWALRGSGSNYGVVASYDFNTFAAPSQVTYFNMPAKWNTTTAPGYLAAVENYTKAVMPADLTMRMYGGSYQHYFEGLFYGDVAGLKAALKPLQDKIPGLAIQSAVNTTWLKGFEHYANANTDPTTPYSMVSVAMSR
jgi:FAD/FMN-containing dehydrogenase